MSKLPVFDYCTLEDACEFIGHGCSIADLWRWRGQGVIDICVKFGSSDAFCEVHVKGDGVIDKAIQTGNALDIGYSRLVNTYYAELPVIPCSDGFVSCYEAGCEGIWIITSPNYLLFSDDCEKYIGWGLTYCLNGMDPQVNGATIIPPDDYLRIDVKKFQRFDYVLCSESLNRIVDNIGKAVVLNSPNAKPSNNSNRPNAHEERHARDRENILACIIHAKHNFPDECKTIEAWFNCINQHNHIYKLDEEDGIISSYVKRIISDAANKKPDERTIIGGQKKVATKK